MRYFLNDINFNSDNKENQNLYLNKISKNKQSNIVYDKKSEFGNTVYKTKISNLFSTEEENSYFSKDRDLKSVISNIKNIDDFTENGFFIDLELIGLGFKITPSSIDNTLIFELHFSHKLYYTLPKNVSFGFENKKVILFGIDKAAIVNVAENIKSLRFPNTYKGKGIKYSDEVIKLKPGKQR